jgi:hypothetical protein
MVIHKEGKDVIEIDTQSGGELAMLCLRLETLGKRRRSRGMFISDVITELDAAKSAGTQALLCLRPGNRPQPATAHPLIRTLDEVFL